MPRREVLDENSAAVAVGGSDPPMEEGKFAEGRGGVK